MYLKAQAFAACKMTVEKDLKVPATGSRGVCVGGGGGGGKLDRPQAKLQVAIEFPRNTEIAGVQMMAGLVILCFFFSGDPDQY